MTKKKTQLEKPLTEVELEVMNAVWDLGETTVKDVQAKLPKGRDLAYTSVATMMKILEQKGVLGSRKGEKAHVYSPKISRDEYEALTLRHLATHLFRGDPTSMVARLVSDTNLSKDELKEIRRILDERMGG